LLIGASEPARKLAGIFGNLQVGCAAANRIYRLIDRESAIRKPIHPKALPTPHRELVFRDVHFHYRQGKSVLTGINLCIPRGETVAIVGSNGCGKTTLAHMISRLYDAVEGQILLDGVNVRDASLDDLRSRIAIVPQQAMIFNDTILNNLRYGSPDASLDDIVAAATRAQAYGFIKNELVDQFETTAGPNGGCLSGGQRQRIALTRAILRKPEVLILDEATSQIDAQSEREIYSELKSNSHGHSTIIITHRMTTAAIADRILVMDSGRIVDDGTHKELLAGSQHYQALFIDHLAKVA
jgi:subfamily B ATP-binding cassette protein MsbA